MEKIFNGIAIAIVWGLCLLILRNIGLSCPISLVIGLHLVALFLALCSCTPSQIESYADPGSTGILS